MGIESKWLKETIDRVPKMNWLYRFCCLFLCRKRLTYNEMYLLLYGLNKKVLGDLESRRFAYNKIIEIYQYLNNNKLPNE